MKRLIIILIALICGNHLLRAQFNRLFTSDDDLPSSLVNKIIEDKEGNIWVATENGLARYNGSSFTSYRHQVGDEHSLANNFVRTLCVDNDGRILVGSVDGLQLYRPTTDDFTPLLIDTAQNIFRGNVADLAVAPDGDILVTGNYTYNVHIDESGQLHAIKMPYSDMLEMSYRYAIDPDGSIWILRLYDDLYRLTSGGMLTPVRGRDGKRIEFSTIGMGPDGNLYAGGSVSGLYTYDRDKQEFVLLSDPSDPFYVRELRPFPGTSTLCIATDGQGVRLYDCETHLFSQFIFDDPFIDATSQKVHSIGITRSGDIWMALYQKGVFVAAPAPKRFRYLGSRSARYNVIGDRCVTSIIQTSDDNIWVGTDNGGLYGLTPDCRPIAHYRSRGTDNGGIPVAIMTLFEDSRHRVWVGAYRQGCCWVDLKNGRCTYPAIEGLNATNCNVYGFVEDKRGQIWVATMGSGLMKYNEQRGMVESVTPNGPLQWSCSMHYDAISDRLLVGTYSGLCIIDLAHDMHFDQIVSDLIVYNVKQSDVDQYVLCTDNGLYIYDFASGQLRGYTTDDGLPHNTLYAAELDSEGNIWMSGINGLSKFTTQRSTFNNYTVRDGLQGNEFYKNASLKAKDGSIWFGGVNGITWFKPQDIFVQAQNYLVRVVGVHADQNNIIADAKGDYHISEDDHSFTIELATLPLSFTQRVIYQYSLDGDNWHSLPPMLNRVSYSAVPSGHHVFSVKALLDGVESDVCVVNIDIAYPWYRRWYAMILWLSVLGVLIYLIFQQVRRRRMIRHRLEVHRQEQAINEAKLDFFMNIAHDIRTPMTLIVTPLQKLLTSDHDPHRQRSYVTIERNANRILNLVNQLMDLRKIDKAQMTLSCQHVGISQVVADLCDSVLDLAQSRHLRLSTHPKVDPGLRLWLDIDCFEKILLNLLSNSIKYTPEGGEVAVTWQQEGANVNFPEGFLRLTVADSGIGIPEYERSHIFERFYQVRSNNMHVVGTGIGLNLVKSLVNLHHGRISVDDGIGGNGTSFIIDLPLGDQLFSREELRDGDKEGGEVIVKPASTAPEAMSSVAIDSAVFIADDSAAVRQGARRILLVDDDDEIRKYLNEELSGNYRVLQCSDGNEALDLLKREQVDLVLSDVMMPGMDGLQLCMKIRSNVRLNHLPIILLTALSTDNDRIEGLETGADAYVAKPFNIEILRTTIDNLLRSHDRLRNTYRGTQLPTGQVETPELKSPDERLLERIVKVINDNLSNSELTTEDIARMVGLSRVHLYRKLKELTNQSARNYFRNIRLTKAAELLSQKKMSIAEVAYLVGFSNPNNFATAFKELYGMTPTQYMESHFEQPPMPTQHPDAASDAEEGEDVEA